MSQCHGNTEERRLRDDKPGHQKCPSSLGIPKASDTSKSASSLNTFKPNPVKTTSELLMVYMKVQMRTDLLRCELEAWFEKIHAFVHRSYTYTWATLCSDLQTDRTARHRLICGQRQRDLKTRKSYEFGTIWGWVNTVMTELFWWTIPLINYTPE